MLGRVLGCQGHEGPLDAVRLAIEADLIFLHRLEQRGLGLGGSPINLVRDQLVREDRAFAADEGSGGHVVHRVAGDVVRHQVGGELYALGLSPEARRDRAGQESLSEPRQAFHENVSRRRKGEEDVVQHFVLALDQAGYLAPDCLDHRAPRLQQYVTNQARTYC